MVLSSLIMRSVTEYKNAKSIKKTLETTLFLVVDPALLAEVGRYVEELAEWVANFVDKHHAPGLLVWSSDPRSKIIMELFNEFDIFNRICSSFFKNRF